MNINQLESFKLGDAVKFHDKLNPKIFVNNKPRPEVKRQLLLIAKDFITELGIHDLDVLDLTISGSNAAYSYTDHSDLDLHIIIDMSKLPNDEVYRELFNSKKTVYNDSHDIKVHGVPVELYVQDNLDPVISLGEYSLLKNKWIKFPTRSRINVNQTITSKKYNKLLELIKLALKSKDIEKVQELLKTIRRYRQAGLDKGGEFSPENLAYKALRSQGYITKLYQLRDKLHGQSLSIESMYESKVLDKPTPTINDLVKKHNVSKEHIMDQLLKGIQVELEHTSDDNKAKEIALDHLGEDPDYYTKLASLDLEEDSGWSMYTSLYRAEKTLPVTPYGIKEKEFRGSISEKIEEASGYIPSESEKNDPRFKTALTVDVKPNTMKNNAKKLGFNISRSGIPPLLK